MDQFKIGLIVNPLAGIGGAVGLKGSDGELVVQQAFERGAVPKAEQRTLQALSELIGFRSQIQWFSYPGAMGENVLQQAGFDPAIVGTLESSRTHAADTEHAAQLLAAQGVDLLLFSGGDGTARNICNGLQGIDIPVLGIPAGVKIHSGVYAVTPKAAAAVVLEMLQGQIVTVERREVRDIDEEAFRSGIVKTQYYGELSVPSEVKYIQAVKCGGREVEALVLEEIAAYVVEQMDPETYYVMGSGSTVAAIMDYLNLDNTLLGIDVICNEQLIAKDVSEQLLLELLENKPAKIVVTVIGGQGHLFGRGNQQLSAKVIRQVSQSGLEKATATQGNSMNSIKDTSFKDSLMVIATHEKISELQGRPLIVDTGDPQLDAQLCGLIPIITGYDHQILYRIALDYS